MDKTKKNGELLNVLTNPSKKLFAEAILQTFEDLGLGSLSKTDFEALMYHQLTLLVKDNVIRDNYDWMKLLKITPAKLRSLQMIQSAKYISLSLDNKDNWTYLLKALKKKNIEIEDKKKGTIRFYVDDVHVQRFIEKFVVEKGSSVDYTLNRNQVVLKYDMYIKLIKKMFKIYELDEKDIVKTLEKDKSSKHIGDKFVSFENYINTVKEKLSEDGVVELVKSGFSQGMTALFKYVTKKIED